MDLDPIQRAAQEQFARQSHRYGAGHVLENLQDLHAALAHVSLPSMARVLDVACGAGHTGLHLASRGHEVTLCDIAAPMLERVRVAAEARGLRVETRHHAAEQLPYADESFELVTCRVAPHHFSSPESFVRESARVLRGGGFFLLIDGTVDDDQPEAEAWLHKVEKLRDPSHNRLLTPATWVAMCERHGLPLVHASVTRFKQPDLEWYFETANTPLENRAKVRELISNIPEPVEKLLRLDDEDGRIVWWWPRLSLVARKSAAAAVPG
jgi:SAM-dependent methyltransferase